MKGKKLKWHHAGLAFGAFVPKTECGLRTVRVKVDYEWDCVDCARCLKRRKHDK